MSVATTPTFRKLSTKESIALLRSNRVGRMAFAFGSHVDIVPIHYVYSRGWLYGRTSVGPKLITLRHSHWVAFEVDQIDGVFDWRSVVVRGALHILDDELPASDGDARKQAIRLLRRVVPRTMRLGDPVPFRDVLFRIHADEVTGRAARSGIRVAQRARGPASKRA